MHTHQYRACEQYKISCEEKLVRVHACAQTNIDHKRLQLNDNAQFYCLIKNFTQVFLRYRERALRTTIHVCIGRRQSLRVGA